MSENYNYTKERIKVKCDFCGEMVDKYPSQIKSRDHHFHNRECMGKWRSENMRGVNAPMYGKHHTKASKKKKSKTSRVPFEIKEMTLELAYVEGVSMGDGYNCNMHGFGVSSIDKDFIDKIDRSLQTFVPDNVPIHRYCNMGDETSTGNQIHRLGVYNMNLAEYLNKVTDNKHKIPDDIMNGSYEIKKEFLRGMMDSEGWITKKKRKNGYVFQISFGVTSLWCYDVKKLFGDLDMKTGKMHIYKFENKKLKDQYVFSINLFDYYNYGMGFSIGWKQARLDSYKPIFEKHHKKLLKNPNYRGHR